MWLQSDLESKQLLQAITLSISQPSVKGSTNSGRKCVLKPDANMKVRSLIQTQEKSHQNAGYINTVL